jgi:hypothetical protein
MSKEGDLLANLKTGTNDPFLSQANRFSFKAAKTPPAGKRMKKSLRLDKDNFISFDNNPVKNGRSILFQ